MVMRDLTDSLASFSGHDKPVTIKGKYLATLTVPSGGNFPYYVSPKAFGPRLFAYASAYQEFRFKKIIMNLTWSTGASNGPYVAAYFKSLPSAAPATQAEAYSGSVFSRYWSANNTSPQRLVIEKGDLNHNVRTWFDVSTTGDPEGYQQGIIYFKTDTAAVQTLPVEIYYEVEFRGATTPNIGADKGDPSDFLLSLFSRHHSDVKTAVTRVDVRPICSCKDADCAIRKLPARDTLGFINE
jgi:hypothetical protein